MATVSAAVPPADHKKDETPAVSARFIERLKSTFDAEKGTDLTIICGKGRWRVHKALLCQHSTVFEGMLHGKFMEAGTSELTLPDDSEHGIEKLLKWMYTFDYISGDPPMGMSQKRDDDFWNGTGTDILLHMEVARTADKYDVPELLEVALVCFTEDSFRWADSEKFMNAVREAYTENWPDQLRQEVVKIVWERMDFWYADDDHTFWEVAEATPRLLIDVVRHGKPEFWHDRKHKWRKRKAAD